MGGDRGRNDLLHRRLLNQRLTGTPLDSAQEVVAWLGAVQAQDYPGAKWALAQRFSRATDAALDAALASGAILRTHVMRPTWHFVAPGAIRWLLALTGPRVNALCAGYYRKQGIDDRVAAKSQAALYEALQGGRYLTRLEVKSVLQRCGIVRPGEGPLRIAFLVMRAELDGLVCSGPMSGKHCTYALLEERVPRVRTMTRQESLAELVARYFTSHGPAMIKDFVWWSGLTAADARNGLEIAESRLARETRDGRIYWGPVRQLSARRAPHPAYLLPAYDEALLSYRDNRDRYAVHMQQLMRDNGQTIVTDGRATGTWRRSIAKDRVAIKATPLTRWTRREKQAIAEAADRYGTFLGLEATVTYADR
jgi:hypothetical protein